MNTSVLVTMAEMRPGEEIATGILPILANEVSQPIDICPRNLAFSVPSRESLLASWLEVLER